MNVETEMTPARIDTSLSQRVLRVHRRTLQDLGREHGQLRFRAALALGIAAVDRIDEALVGEVEPATVLRVIGQQRAQLREHRTLDERDGWDVTALAWTLYALERIERAVRGVTAPRDLGLPTTTPTSEGRTA